jgi:hypothetical protein
MKLPVLLWLSVLPLVAWAQAVRPATAEIRRYGIEVAGLRVGTMTATRQPLAGADVVYSLVSEVKVTILFYHLKVYYQVANRFRNGQLLLSTVEAHTNQGDFSSRAEWKGDHYDIVADQYKHHYRTTETQPIRYAVTNMFFAPPSNQARAYAEYFGDYFTLRAGSSGTCHATRAGREDEYQYANGELIKIIKKNPVKNFIIRLLPAGSE